MARTIVSILLCAWVLWESGGSYNRELSDIDLLNQAEEGHWFVKFAAERLADCRTELKRQADAQYSALGIRVVATP